MDALFKLLSSNSFLANLALSLVSLVLLMAIVIYIMAFLQGRSISFWPPKIGDRHSPREKDVSSGTDHSDKALGWTSPLFTFISAKELERADPMVDLIERSKRLLVAGVALGHAAKRYRAQMEAQLDKGADLRFLLLDPSSRDADAIARMFDLPSNQVRDDIRVTLRNIEVLKRRVKATGRGSVEVRLLEREPSLSFILSNPDLDDAYFCAGLRAYGHRSTTRPHFVLRPPNVWFDYFKENCDALWGSGEPWKGDPEAIKPVMEKAGVVPYRLATDDEVEVAVITSRKEPKRWIFPVGDVGDGESLSEAAARECEEESGCVVDIVSKLGLNEFQQGSEISRMTFFAGVVRRETGHREVDRELKWVRLPELPHVVADDFKTLARAAVASLATAAQRREVAQQWARSDAEDRATQP